MKMFATINYSLLCFTAAIIPYVTCTAEPTQTLTLYSTDDLEYTDVVVKRVSDSLELVCELHGTPQPRRHVWNYVATDPSTEHTPYVTEPDPLTPTIVSKLYKHNLTTSDSGHYMCSAPPFSRTKYILVQEKGPAHCAHSSFWCGQYCVLPAYVCDGRDDCKRGEDEDPKLCDRPCQRADRLNCSDGRCIPVSACCAAPSALCKQPACCREHADVLGLIDIEYPPLFEDRHAPDDYGFIQSTIYTVTACALIFMIAVVLLVSAICKMHMKRCALRSYARAERATRDHYNNHYEAHRFPPCYEASRLLEQDARRAASPSHTPHTSPTRQPLQCSTECPQLDSPTSPQDESRGSSFGLARLSSIFSARYRQVPTQCLDVELTDVRPSSAQTSPTRTRTRLDHYRSPTYCDLNSELFFNPEISDCGRDLNYMATPLEFFRRRNLRDGNTFQRPLTLQLGRFQLSIPRLGRRQSLERRPDTPNVAELNIDDLDFVRLNSNETYTLNGRTIRLLGGNFENYPILNDNATRPPPYTEAMRYKIYGPPPEYLSRDALNDERVPGYQNTGTEEQARTNIEMPPNYEELATGVDTNANVQNDLANNEDLNLNNEQNVIDNGVNNVADTGLNNTTVNYVNNGTISITNVVPNNITNHGINIAATNCVNNGTISITNVVPNNVNGIKNSANHCVNHGTINVTNVVNHNGTNIDINNAIQSELSSAQNEMPNNNTLLTNIDSSQPCLRSVIDNLPAIDSDVNANEESNDRNNVCVNNNGY